MTFFLFWTKKYLTWLLYPLVTIIFAQALGLFFLLRGKHPILSKGLLVGSWIWLVLASSPWTANWMVYQLEKQYSPLGTRESILAQYPEADQVKYIVVLGGGAYEEDSVRDASSIVRLPYGAMRRVVEAVRLHRLFPQTTIIVSGGTLFDVEEAEVMKRVAIELGVDPNSVLKENKSLDTHDQSILIKPIVRENEFFLVTSGWHMPRSMGLFKKQGNHCIPAPTDFIADHSDHSKHFVTYSLPLSSLAFDLSESDLVLKEVLGMLWGKLSGEI